ncbi:transmembrane protein 82-like [Megalops cyprinoides]|uniref:transmembrane protein 82-like n=1 Tax=Megalops cyprinoides TaxID=118141 RepID=UPI0018649C0B|nr:transmembrane protein 82-like [Megalops cyprinoides]
MISFFHSWLPGMPWWLTFEANPLDSLLQGLLAACGISVLCSLMRVHFFLKALSDEKEDGSKEKSSPKGEVKGWLSGSLQFWFLAMLLGMVGVRAASLVVLEFCLRAVSARITSGPDTLSSYSYQFLIQCQFSLGCALSCSIHFLQEGALHRSLGLLLAAGLSWVLAGQCGRLWRHTAVLYPLHSSQRYCGVCITLLTSGRSLLPLLGRAVALVFAVGAFAATFTVNHHFLSAAESLRFWTPLTICYTLLVVYIQEEQHRRPGGEALMHTVVLRLGALLVLMLTVGTWADVAHILLCFLGEAACLIPAQDLLDCLPEEEEEDETPSKPPRSWSTESSPRSRLKPSPLPSRDKDL